MNLGFPLFPEQASTMAARVDALFFFLIAVSVFFVALIFLVILVFAVKYRRRADDERPEPIEGKALAGGALVRDPFRFDHGDVCLGRADFF